MILTFLKIFVQSCLRKWPDRLGVIKFNRNNVHKEYGN